MRNLPSRDAIIEALKQTGLEPNTPNFFDQTLLAWEFIDAQISNGAKQGKLLPEKELFEGWAVLYISANAVWVALHLHGLTGLSRKPVFPDPKRLIRHPLAGSHINYARDIYHALDAYNSLYSRPRIDDLGFTGAEGAGRKNSDLAKAIAEHRSLMESRNTGTGGSENG